MRHDQELIVIGAHAEGEVGNVVIDGVGDIPGSTMLEKRDYLREHKDHIRKTLLLEPRGAPYHSANIIFPSNDPSADIGFVCAEVSKYPLMSGSNLICVATVVLETGIVAMHEPVTTLAIESPGGLITTECECKDGKVTSVSFRNVPCVPISIGQEIELEGAGAISVDIASELRYCV